MTTQIKYKQKRVLTIPTLVLKDNQPVILKFTGPMFTGKIMPVKEGQTEKAPATLANVVDVETGEVYQLMVNSVLHALLDEEYEDNAYVGKVFSVERLPARAGKAYNGFKVSEMELESGADHFTEHPQADAVKDKAKK